MQVPGGFFDGQGYVGSNMIHKLRHGCIHQEYLLWKKNALNSKFVDSSTVFVDARLIDTHVNAMRGITKMVLTNFESNYLCRK